jgi:dihydroneopterin aldolase
VDVMDTHDSAAAMDRWDKIVLTGMQFYGHHGVYPEENRLGQRFVVDVELHLDVSEAGRSDLLEHTVNYAEVYEQVRAVVEERTFRLIESLAEHIASQVLASYTIVNAATVRVTKPHPPFPAHFGGVTVEIFRKR